MKAQIKLRSTLSNATSAQRASAALAALALMVLIGALLISVARPGAPSISQAHVSIPAQRSNAMLNFGTGSVYDGGHYVTSHPTKRVSPSGLNFGTGSVYDGGHYVDLPSAKRSSPSVLNFGTGSVYDGGHYGAVPTRNVTVKP